MWISEEKIARKLQNKKTNAKTRGLACTLTIHDLRTIFMRNGGICDYTGKPFDESSELTSCSIERIDADLGYVVGNICLVSVKANGIKDRILDTPEVDTVKVLKGDLPILAALSVKLTEEYLKHLARKYNPRIPYNPETDPYKNYFDDLTGHKIVSNLPTEDHKFAMEELKMSDVQWTEEEKAANKMPDDVHIASYYSALAGAARKTGMKFNLSYAEFKGRFSRKTCALTGKVLDLDHKFILVLDNKKPLSRENLAVVDEELGHKVNKMSDEMGLSVEEMAKMFKRLA